MEQQSIDKSAKPQSKINSLVVFNLILSIAVIALAGTTYFLYQEYQESQDEIDKLRDPANIDQIQNDLVAQTVDAVENIVVTPSEEPTVATILDVDSLITENETFYADAQNGDRLLVYTTKAIIFRESTGQIVNIAPVFIENIETLEEFDTEDVQ